VAVVVLVLSIISRTTSSVTPPPIALDAIPFTTYAGNEECPAISPDGTRIAFCWYTEESENYDIFVKQANTEKPLRLSEGDDHEIYPTWSPDGANLAYALYTDEGAAIYTIPAIGGTRRKVVDLPFGVAGIDWSPDGRHLVYSSRRGCYGSMRVYLYSFETGESEELTTPPWSSQGDFRPAFSPDGESIAFIRGDRTQLQDVFVVPTAGGEARRLTSSQHRVAGLDWMPDGKSLVFSAGPSAPGDLRLWRLSLEDGSLTWLPTPSHRAARPSVALTGGRMVFEDQDYHSDIEKVTIGGGTRETKTIVASTRHDYGPQYSPGGTYISFISNRSGSPQIWVCDGEGCGCRQLTHFDNAYIQYPRWSYDERRVAFTAAPGSYTSIYVGDVETGEVKRLSSSERHEMCLGWSRDGEWIYCKSERNDSWWVWKMRVDGTETVDIMEQDVFRLAETTDGEHLMYSRADTSGVWRASIDGTGEICLINEPGVVVPCGWREDPEGVYFFNLYEGDVCMWLKDAETGEPRMLTAEADFNSTNIDVAPHGEAVIYDRVEHTGSDLSIVEDFH
jgi:Tol biopolymer transport system component